MNKSQLLILVSLFCVITVSCVPKSKYVAVENELTSTRHQLEQEKLKLVELKKEKDKIAKELGLLQEEHQYLTAINQRLSDNIRKLSVRAQKLKVELEKHKSVVHLQDQVIKLLDDTKKTIESSLKDQMADQGIEIADTKEPVKVVLVDKILYRPGGLEISEKGKKLLLALAESFKKDKTQQIVVEGHTDRTPLGEELRQKYPTNWELSAGRAAAVVRFLQWQGGLDPERLSIRAYSSYRPMASNKTEKGRRMNRRIEIILGPPE